MNHKHPIEPHVTPEHWAGESAPATPQKRAVVLLSGGLDSATAAAWAGREGYALTALSIDYGQRYRVELHCAQAVATAFGISDHMILSVDLAAFGKSGSCGYGNACPEEQIRCADGLWYSQYLRARTEYDFSFASIGTGRSPRSRRHRARRKRNRLQWLSRLPARILNGFRSGCAAGNKGWH